MGRKVIEGTLDQLADRGLRRQSLEIELAFLGADLLIDPFQHGEIERVLVAEIVVDELLVDAGALGDVVDAGAGEAAAGKLAPRRREQLLPRRSRIAPFRTV